jgi:predicted nucleic acid-binding protein
VTTLVDSTVLSNCAAVDRLDLLELALGRSYIADAALDEVRRGARLGHPHLEMIERHLELAEQTGWLRPAAIQSASERELLAGISRSLHQGEAVSLALAAHRRWTLITDDLPARRAAARMGMPVFGTLGILIGLVDANDLTMDEANALLRDMIDRASYRSPVSDLRDLS